MILAVAYALAAIPFVAGLTLLAWALRKRRVSRSRSIAIFTIAAVLALAPFASLMASLFVGAIPMGYVLLSIPFESDGALAFYTRVFYEYLAGHLVGMALVGALAAYVGHRVFRNDLTRPCARREAGEA